MKKNVSKRVLSAFLAVVMTVFVIPTTVINTAAQNSFEDVTELKSWQSIGYGFNAIIGNLSNPEPSTNAILDFEKMEDAGFGVVGSTRTGSDGGYIKSQTMSEIVNSYTDEFTVDVKAKFPIQKINLGVEVKFSNKDSGSSGTVESELYQMYYSNAIRNKYSLRGYDGNVAELSANLSDDFKDKISAIEEKILMGEDATEEIKQLYEYYGTHLILSYYTGGRLEITNHLTSSEYREEQQLTNASSLGISAGIGSFSIGFDISNTNTVTTSSKDGLVNEAINVKNFGGLYPELTAFTSAAYSNWLNSLDDQKNQAMIGFVNDYSLVPIWELVDNSDVKGKMYAVFNNQCQTACSEYYTKYKDNESKIVGYVYKNAGVNNYAYVDMTASGAKYVAQDSTLYLNFLLSSEYISKEDITYEISTGSDYATVGEKSGILTVSPNATDGSVIEALVKAGGVQLSAQSFVVKTEGNGSFAGGYGTEERPYLISKTEHFDKLANTSSYADRHFLLIQDVDAKGGSLDPIPNFSGTFDGNGYAVYNFIINSAEDVTGLFREVTSTGTVKNLQIGKADFSNDVLGSKIENVSKAGLKGYSAIIYADNYYTFYVGGLVGKNYGTVENCKVVNTLVYGYANEDSAHYKTYICMAGGLTGLNMGNVANCEVTDSYVKSYVISADDGNEPQCCAYSGGLIGMDGTEIPRDWRWDTDPEHKEWKDKTNSTTISYSTVGNSTLDSYVHSEALYDGEGYIRSGGLIGYYKTSTTAIKYCIVYENTIKEDNDTDGDSKYGSFIGFVPGSVYDISSCYAGDCSDTKYEIGNILDAENLYGNLTLDEMYDEMSKNDDINRVYIVSDRCWPQLNKVSAIKLNTDNVDKEYHKGESFNPLGLTVVYQKYAVGNNEVPQIPHFQLLVEPLSSLGTKTVTVSYAGYSAEFNVNVVCAHPTPTMVTGDKATCTDTGLTDGLYCSDCGIWLEEQVAIEKNNDHSFGTWIKHDDAQHSHVCECGEIEYKEHNWDTGTVTTEPTYTTTGLMTYTCGDCKSTTTEVIPVLEIPENAPYIVVDAKNAVIGSTVTVKISLTNNPGVTSMRINVAYDSARLTLTEVEYNTAMGGQTVLPENIEALNGNVVLYWADGFANYEGDDVFATLTFEVSDDAVVDTTTTIAVTYDTEDIYDADESNVTFFCEDGIITFIDYTPGDISGDGVLNSKDVTRLMRYLADWDVEVNEVALDVNGDGVVNTKDTTRLMRYLADWDVEIY